jgi:hypothetical protein
MAQHGVDRMRTAVTWTLALLRVCLQVLRAAATATPMEGFVMETVYKGASGSR